MALDLIAFGRTFDLGSRLFTPSTEVGNWVAGADGLFVQKALETGEKAIRTQGIIVGVEGLYGLGYEVGVDPDGIATFREILPQDGGQKIGSVSRPWAELHATAIYGSGANLTGIELTLHKGAANGYASLDGSGKVPQAQLPAIAITDTFVVASEAAMLALTAETGDVAVRTDVNESYILRGTSASTLADWEKLRTPTTIPAASIVTKTANYTQVAADRFIKCDPSAGNFTITLLAAASFVGIPLTLKHIGTAGAVTIDPNGSENIDTYSDVTLNVPGSSITIMSDGTVWRIM